jgi:hypothetical protein
MRRRFDLALILGLLAAFPAFADDALTHLGNYTWRGAQDGFGGFSGFDLLPNGVDFLAVSDRGFIAHGTLERGADGVVERVDLARLQRLRDQDGAALYGQMGDSEGLALDSDGRFFVSFEGVHRVWSYASPGAHSLWMPRAPRFGISAGTRRWKRLPSARMAQSTPFQSDQRGRLCPFGCFAIATGNGPCRSRSRGVTNSCRLAPTLGPMGGYTC